MCFYCSAAWGFEKEIYDARHVLAVFSGRDRGCDPDERCPWGKLGVQQEIAVGLTAIHRAAECLRDSCSRKSSGAR